MFFIMTAILMISQCGLSSSQDSLSSVECEPDPVGYIIPDPARCDRYLDCDPVTGRNVRYCLPGSGLELDTGLCAPLQDIHCGHRKISSSLPSYRSQHNSKQSVFTSSKLHDTKLPDTTKTLTEHGRRHLKQQEPDITTRDVAASVSSVVCNPTPEGYVVPDHSQCDRYIECSPEGDTRIRLCPDGLGLDVDTGKCDYLYKVDCGDRKLLQVSKHNGLCLRENGHFPLPAEVSCTDYLDCRDGEQYLQSCGAGAVFDPSLGCVHPDQTQRPGCTAQDQYKVQCPRLARGSTLRFGDHDRIPHPGGKCGLFYACLRNGQPRLLGCEKPTVFNPETGFCDKQENVSGCEETYTQQEIAQFLREQLNNEEEVSSELRQTEAEP